MQVAVIRWYQWRSCQVEESRSPCRAMVLTRDEHKRHRRHIMKWISHEPWTNTFTSMPRIYYATWLSKCQYAVSICKIYSSFNLNYCYHLVLTLDKQNIPKHRLWSQWGSPLGNWELFDVTNAGQTSENNSETDWRWTVAKHVGIFRQCDH